MRAGDSKVTLESLTGTWDAASMGDRPAAWIPQSTIWSAELATAKPDAIEGTPTSLVTTPVVLAVQPDLGSKAKGTLQWSQLPTLQSSDGSLSTLGLPEYPGHCGWRCRVARSRTPRASPRRPSPRHSPVPPDR